MTLETKIADIVRSAVAIKTPSETLDTVVTVDGVQTEHWWTGDDFGNGYLCCDFPADGDYEILWRTTEPLDWRNVGMVTGLQGPYPGNKQGMTTNALASVGIHSFQEQQWSRLRLAPGIREKIIAIAFRFKGTADQCWGWDDSDWDETKDRFSLTRTFAGNLSGWGAWKGTQDGVLLDPWTVAVAMHWHPTKLEFYGDRSPMLRDVATLKTKLGQKGDLGIYRLDHAVTAVDPMPTLPVSALVQGLQGVAGSWPWTIMPFTLPSTYPYTSVRIPSVLVNPRLPSGDSGSLAVALYQGRAAAIGMAWSASSAGTYYTVPSIPYYADWIRSLGVQLEVIE